MQKGGLYINKPKNNHWSCVTDCSLLSLDSPCHVASLVGKCGRPAALVCVYALETDSYLSGKPPLDQRCAAVYCTWTNQMGLSSLALMTAAWQVSLGGHHRKGELNLTCISPSFFVSLFFYNFSKPFFGVSVISCYLITSFIKELGRKQVWALHLLLSPKGGNGLFAVKLSVWGLQNCILHATNFSM